MANAPGDLRAPHVVGAQAARALRLELDLGFAPVSGPHLWEVIADRGIDLAFHKFGRQAGDGLYLWDGTRGLMVLNTSGRKALRLRFTAAHELGHHELHRHTVPSVLISDMVVREPNADVPDAIEREAGAFAAEFLAPVEGLRRELRGRDSAEFTPIDVVRLMRTYGLSYESLLWRLQNAAILNPRDRVRLEDEGRGRVRHLEAALGFKEDEQFGPPAPQFLPEQFRLNVLRLHNEGALKTARVAELLRIKESEASQLASEVAQVGPPTDAIDDLLR